MPICKNCGVEIESTKKKCPLCQATLGEKVIVHEEKHAVTPITKKQKIHSPFLMELFSFFSAAGAIVVAAVDFAYGADLTWSRIPLSSIIFCWLFVFLIHHLIKKPYLLVVLETINFLIFLWFLDRFIPVYSWFFSLALPIIVVVGILFLLVILWIRSFKLSTFLSLSVGTLAVGIFLLCLEVILNKFHQENLMVSWSLVAFACILPVSGFFIYFQLRINKKDSELKKYFHI
ncbi:MAG: DUF6320 domain-containing protein [Candidatus Cloacimonetes bacterium]|nr:DUF6320 domain-containing protein [Candidatus Cloacimonadota bacterium]MCF7813629.1 DUF6320 domain-containing protein [Candidatus Cloacimonadota bacterium]MCF7868308.1 DUF6320 domain-containing protein [Candidatus Cloacimonadota bacterium]MCF7883783.1 DUF6320 domain-containing protein [Candidatus Cloacimonadota bacterium]